MKVKGFFLKINTPIKYCLSSIVSFGIDYGIYVFFIRYFYVSATISYIIGRTISSVINFSLNKFLVFKSKEKKLGLLREILSYYILVVVIMVLGSISVHIAVENLSLNEYIVKPFIDCILFILSYCIQHLIVFKKRRSQKSI